MDCSRYIECIGGIPTPRICPATTFYDPWEDNCNYEAAVLELCKNGGPKVPTTVNVETEVITTEATTFETTTGIRRNYMRQD
jgi:hypothetical protein